MYLLSCPMGHQCICLRLLLLLLLLLLHMLINRPSLCLMAAGLLDAAASPVA